MKPRVAEAQRLEDGYMLRLKSSLAEKDSALANEIIQNIREHIEEAVNESSENEISAVKMTEILERLGSPESYINEFSGLPSEKQSNAKDAKILTEDQEKYSGFLSKLWVAYLIGTIGLYIPIIELHFCSIIYLALIIGIFVKLKMSQTELSNSIIGLSIIQLVLLVLAFAISTAGIYFPFIEVINTPVGIAIAVIALVIDWKVLGFVSEILKKTGKNEVAKQIEVSRKRYVIASCIFYVVALMVAIPFEMAFRTRQPLIMDLIIYPLLNLPATWLICWLFLLRPISTAKQSIKL